MRRIKNILKFLMKVIHFPIFLQIRNNKGLTLIEVIIALVIMGFIIVGLLNLVVKDLSIERFNEEQDVASTVYVSSIQRVEGIMGSLDAAGGLNDCLADIYTYNNPPVPLYICETDKPPTGKCRNDFFKIITSSTDINKYIDTTNNNCKSYVGDPKSTGQLYYRAYVQPISDEKNSSCSFSKNKLGLNIVVKWAPDTLDKTEREISIIKCF